MKALALGPCVEKYVAIAVLNIKERVAHRAEFIITILKNAFVLRVSYELLFATYQTQGITSFAGLTAAQSLWILVIARLYRSASRTAGITKEIMDEVKSGDIAYSLNRPLSYIGYHGAAFFGAQVPMIFANAFVSFVLAFWWAGPIPFTCSE